jgi:hypothetical protein
VPAAIFTGVQIKTGALNPVEVLRMRWVQSSSTVSTQQPIEFCRLTAAATVTGVTPKILGPWDDPAAKAVSGATATGVNASIEGTPGDILLQDVWNYLTGFYWSPVVPEDKIYVDAATGTRGIVGLRLPVAPGGTYTGTADVIFKEL